jgi:hypothetical protein
VTSDERSPAGWNARRRAPLRLTFMAPSSSPGTLPGWLRKY